MPNIYTINIHLENYSAPDRTKASAKQDKSRPSNDHQHCTRSRELQWSRNPLHPYRYHCLGQADIQRKPLDQGCCRNNCGEYCHFHNSYKDKPCSISPHGQNIGNTYTVVRINSLSSKLIDDNGEVTLSCSTTKSIQGIRSWKIINLTYSATGQLFFNTPHIYAFQFELTWNKREDLHERLPLHETQSLIVFALSFPHCRRWKKIFNRKKYHHKVTLLRSQTWGLEQKPPSSYRFFFSSLPPHPYPILVWPIPHDRTHFGLRNVTLLWVSEYLISKINFTYSTHNVLTLANSMIFCVQ